MALPSACRYFTSKLLHLGKLLSPGEARMVVVTLGLVTAGLACKRLSKQRNECQGKWPLATSGVR